MCVLQKRWFRYNYGPRRCGVGYGTVHGGGLQVDELLLLLLPLLLLRPMAATGLDDEAVLHKVLADVLHLGVHDVC